MRWFTLEPRDPLMVRDGRPLGGGVDSVRSQNMVPPSVTAGALRTRVWHTKGGWNVEEAKATPVRGPLLGELDGDDQLVRCWLSAPRDCALFDPDESDPKTAGVHLHRYALGPGKAWPEGMSSLPGGLVPVVPIASGGMPKAKPAKNPPAFWSSEEVERWLRTSPPGQSFLSASAGRPNLHHETRLHVAIDPLNGTTNDGDFFQSDGLRFTERTAQGTYNRLALVVGCDRKELAAGYLHLGGERRLSALRPLAGKGPLWESPKLGGPRARVLLLTPACFAEGAVPKSIGGAPVIAAAVGRPLTLSGWDMAAGGPKPARRFAPAGTVYWVDLERVNIRDWRNAVHFQGICSDAQDNRDGFGLAVVGVSE